MLGKLNDIEELLYLYAQCQVAFPDLPEERLWEVFDSAKKEKDPIGTVKRTATIRLFM